MGHRMGVVAGDDHPIAGLIWRLESEGWSFAEDVIVRADGRLTWTITGRNGPKAIRAEGANMAEAWAGAAAQARNPVPGPARLDPASLLRLDFEGPRRDHTTADPADRPCSLEVQIGRSWTALHDRAEPAAADRPDNPPGPRHRGRRRAESRLHRGQDHARRANPNRY